jgi:hypothetical protein
MALRVIQSWQYAPSHARLIPQQATPVHMNLWLFRGMTPSNGEEVEIVVSPIYALRSTR